MIIKLAILSAISIAGTALARDTIYRCIDEQGNDAFSGTTCNIVGNVLLPDHQVVKQELFKIDQVDRKIGAIKREIMDLEHEKRAALASIHTRQEAVDSIAEAAIALETEYDERIADLSRELTALGKARNVLMEHSLTVFLDQR